MRRCRGRGFRGRRRRVLVHFRFDHDALDAAEEAALLDEDAMRDLVSLYAVRVSRGGECFFESMSFEPLGH
jgi:hypothetical protein